MAGNSLHLNDINKKNKKKISLDYDVVKNYLNQLYRYKNFKYKDVINIKHPELGDYFLDEEGTDPTLSSLNIWAIKALIDKLEYKLEQKSEYPSDKDQLWYDDDLISELRDRLAEAIENLQEGTALPNIINLYLCLLSAFEEDNAARSPLVSYYVDKIEKSRSSPPIDPIFDIVMDSVVLFLNRTLDNYKQFGSLLKSVKNFRDDYINVIKGSSPDDIVVSDDDMDDSELFDGDVNDLDVRSLTDDDMDEIRVKLLLLEIPDILYEFLSYYFVKGKYLNSAELLDDLSRTLFDMGYSLYSVIPGILSKIILKINKRLVRHIDAGEYTDNLRNYLFSKGYYELWPPQFRAIERFKNIGNSYFLYQPTSSGKSLVAEVWILKHLLKHPDRVVIYLVPTKSLAVQVTDDLSASYSVHTSFYNSVIDSVSHTSSNYVPDSRYNYVVSNLSGEQLHPILDMARKNFSNILVMTPEKFTLLYQNGEFDIHPPSTIVIDEAHGLLGINTREFTNSVSILKFRLKFPGVPILALSAVIDEPDIMRDWPEMGFTLLGSKWRSTRLKSYVINTADKLSITSLDNSDDNIQLESVFKKLNTPKHVVRLLQSIKHSYGRVPNAIIFCSSRKETVRYAQEFYDRQTIEDTNDELVSFIKDELGEGDLVKFVRRKVAYHHAGLPPTVREKLLHALKDGLIDVICATTTLAEGLNTPVDIVIVVRPYFYNHKTGISDKISYSVIKNMFGRAGRANFSGIGRSYIYTKDMDAHKNIAIKPDINKSTRFWESYRLSPDSLDRVNISPANYEVDDILKFRTSIYALVCDGLIDSKNVDLFVNKIDPIRRRQFRDPIQKVVQNFSGVRSLLVEHSPLTATELGWLCFRTAMDPLSFTGYIEFIDNIRDDLSFIQSTTFLKLTRENRRKLLKLLFVPDEARVEKYNTISPEHRYILLDRWLSSDGSLIVAKKEFEAEVGTETDIYDISTTIFDIFGNTITWISWVLFQILEYHYGMDIDPSYSLMPFYIKSGISEPFHAILSGFNLSKSTINRYFSLLPENLRNSEDIVSLFEWIIYELPDKLRKSSFKEDELNSLLFKSLKSAEEWNKSIFIAAFLSGWYDLAMNSLEKIKVDNDIMEQCLDHILFNYVNYAGKLKDMKLDDKIKTVENLLDDKKTAKHKTLNRILTEMVSRFKI